MYYAYIAPLKNVRKHPNADRLLIADILGNQVIVGLDYQEGESLIYFGSDGALSEEFAVHNRLTRELGGYLESNKRVRTCKLRGVISDGLALRLSSLKGLVSDRVLSTLKVGDRFDTLDGKKICEKYIAKATVSQRQRNFSKGRRGETKYFPKHFDTEQLNYYIDRLKVGDILVLTSKCHGTSFRSCNVLDTIDLGPLKRFINKFYPIFPTTQYKFLHGTRNVILDERAPNCQFHTKDFREAVADVFRGKLNKGEIVFGEVVGYEAPNKTIMPAHNTAKLNDKKFTTTYGEQMVYSYGCKNDEFKVVVYRVAIVTEDGLIYDLPWDTVKRRAKQLGVEHVYEFERYIYDGDKDTLMNKIKLYGDAPDPVGAHWSEGVCVRVDNDATNLKIYKMKSIVFKILEGLAKDSDSYVDTEESN